jgi:RNA polymerase sigma-70 factor (ECF subfamily)
MPEWHDAGPDSSPDAGTNIGPDTSSNPGFGIGAGHDLSHGDESLIKSAQEGDSEAFGLLYERHAPAVFRYLYAHIDSRLDAEDLTEEVFLRLWRSLNNFREQGVPFGAYLFRIARNSLVDHYRRSSRTSKPVSLEENTIRDSRPDPAEAAAKSIESQEIRKLLDQLREDHRTVLLLRFMGGLSPEETAEVMGKSAGAIRVLQHRALAALKNILGPLVD